MSQITLTGAGRSAAAPAGWWMAAGVAPIAAYQAKGAASLAASYVNLANPGTYDLTAGGTGDPGWAASTGWDNTLVAGRFLITGIVPAHGYSMIARFSSAPAGLKCVAAIGANGFDFGIDPNTEGPGGSAYNAYGGLVYSGAGTAIASGVVAITQTNIYNNGVSVAAHSNVLGVVTDAIYVLATNNGGAAQAGYDGLMQALAIYPSSIGAGIVALTAAMAAL